MTMSLSKLAADYTKRLAALKERRDPEGLAALAAQHKADLAATSKAYHQKVFTPGNPVDDDDFMFEYAKFHAKQKVLMEEHAKKLQALEAALPMIKKAADVAGPSVASHLADMFGDEAVYSVLDPSKHAELMSEMDAILAADMQRKRHEAAIPAYFFDPVAS